jgi:hypothetical protein
MKITISPTENQNKEDDFKYTTVEISLPYDDVSITEALEMVRGALLAWGFHPDSVNEVIPD